MDVMTRKAVEDEKKKLPAGQPGDIVEIFQCPMTEEKPQGKAQLIKMIIDDPDMQYWKIVFLKDGFPGERWIKKKLIKIP